MKEQAEGAWDLNALLSSPLRTSLKPQKVAGLSAESESDSVHLGELRGHGFRGVNNRGHCCNQTASWASQMTSPAAASFYGRELDWNWNIWILLLALSSAHCVSLGEVTFLPWPLVIAGETKIFGEGLPLLSHVSKAESLP